MRRNAGPLNSVQMSDTASREAAPSRWAAPSLIAVIFINMLGFGIIVPLLPFYAKSFNAPGWQIGLIFAAYSVGAFFGEPFWGRLSDKYGRKPLLISTICGNCLCYLALAFAPNIWAAFFIRPCRLSGMPGPWSCTSMRSWSPTRRQPINTRPRGL